MQNREEQVVAMLSDSVIGSGYNVRLLAASHVTWQPTDDSVANKSAKNCF